MSSFVSDPCCLCRSLFLLYFQNLSMKSSVPSLSPDISQQMCAYSLRSKFWTFEITWCQGACPLSWNTQFHKMHQNECGSKVIIPTNIHQPHSRKMPPRIGLIGCLFPSTLLRALLSPNFTTAFQALEASPYSSTVESQRTAKQLPATSCQQAMTSFACRSSAFHCTKAFSTSMRDRCNEARASCRIVDLWLKQQ